MFNIGLYININWKDALLLDVTTFVTDLNILLQ